MPSPRTTSRHPSLHALLKCINLWSYIPQLVLHPLSASLVGVEKVYALVNSISIETHEQAMRNEASILYCVRRCILVLARVSLLYKMRRLYRFSKTTAYKIKSRTSVVTPSNSPVAGLNNALLIHHSTKSPFSETFLSRNHPSFR